MTDREKAMMLFGPYSVKRTDTDYEVLQAQVWPPGSPEFRRLWAVWEEIDRERHENPPCDDPYCDGCGRMFMGDDW